MAYNQYGPRRPAVRFGPPMTRVVKVFVIICAAVFGLEFFINVLFGPEAFSGFIRIFGLVPDMIIKGCIWQVVTFNFLHGGFWHLFLNLFAIWMFGSSLELTFGPRRTIIYFCITGIGAGLLNLAAMPLMPRQEWAIPSIGASGIAYGVLLAYGYLWPRRRILLMFLFPIEARWLVIVYGLVELGSSIQMVRGQGGSGIAHIAHLGGMLFGFIYLRYGVLYHKVRENRYRKKLDKLKKRFEVLDGGKDDDDKPMIH